MRARGLPVGLRDMAALSLLLVAATMYGEPAQQAGVRGAARDPQGAPAVRSPTAPLYVPPSPSRERRIGAGTRGQGRFGSLLLLAPDHLAFTSREQPTLYWYLAEPTSTRIDVTLRDETSVAPLLEVQVPLPAAAGVHALRLSDYGVRLRRDTSYLWFVSLVVDPGQRSRDFSMGAWIRRGDPAPAGEDATGYARAGLWYDAIDVAWAARAAAPGDWAALLAQVGLSEVAAHDPGAATP